MSLWLVFQRTVSGGALLSKWKVTKGISCRNLSGIRPAGAQDVWCYTEIQLHGAPKACQSPSHTPLLTQLEPFWIFNADAILMPLLPQQDEPGVR